MSVHTAVNTFFINGCDETVFKFVHATFGIKPIWVSFDSNAYFSFDSNAYFSYVHFVYEII